MKNKNNEEIMVSADVNPSASSAGIRSEVPLDGLGQVGAFFSTYHVGDMAGLIGLLLTWFTFIQARAAKEAAVKAAKAAIEQRDKMEVAARLTELSGKLREIRDVYRNDKWDFLEVSRDRAVSIVVEVKVTEFKNADFLETLEKIELFLREDHPLIEHVKDDVKRSKLKSKLSNTASKFADTIDYEKTKRVKNGNR